MQDPTQFGFKKVRAEEKAPLVRSVFDRVASRYDLMNDVMSFSLHRLWKNEMVARLNPQPNQHIIDVAGGTGDIAFRMVKRAGCRVTALDINHAMLSEGRDRALNQNKTAGIDWVCADAESLPLVSNRYDAYTIAFGIRNVTHIGNALAEAYRVLKPGGRFLCLEFSRVSPGLQKIYDAYSFKLIPAFGQWITGDRDAYQYLVESIRTFPSQDDFATMIKAAGFGNVHYRNLTQGVVALHSGRKL